MLPDNIDKLMTLYDLEEELQKVGYDVKYHNLQTWSTRPRLNFPAPKEVLGGYRFYDFDEVQRWVHLWLKATERITIANRKRGQPNG